MILKKRNFEREEIFREKKFDVGEEEVWWRKRRILVEEKRKLGYGEIRWRRRRNLVEDRGG